MRHGPLGLVPPVRPSGTSATPQVVEVVSFIKGQGGLKNGNDTGQAGVHAAGVDRTETGPGPVAPPGRRGGAALARALGQADRPRAADVRPDGADASVPAVFPLRRGRAVRADRARLLPFPGEM